MRDDDIEAADRLLDQADALLRRHRADEPTVEGGDDLPILTDVVDESDPALPRLIEQHPAAQPMPAFTPPPQAAPAHPDLSHTLAEHLIRLDTEVSREIEDWIQRELPQLLAREFEAFSERLRLEALENLRATLLPRLSDRIAKHLDESEPPR
ncbi:hypothetical protein E6C76_20815 [Pseudothauera nasutitermitis]|uniref:Uncharacterized protein n=1 Tax=Pseudothauera nasutitermitis TaxID=2565930 RepID=A0A4S4AQS8_9RHOO|nr:hypothetical protein E6C76_20815 [Pseudothauera nasutitermitis]